MRGLCHTACAWTLMTSCDMLPGGLCKQPQGPHEARSAAPDTDSEPEALPPAAGHCRLEASALSHQHTCHERAPMSLADTPQARPVRGVKAAGSPSRAQEAGGAAVPEVLGGDGGGDPRPLPRDVSPHQHKGTGTKCADTPMPHMHAHSFQTHSEHRPQAPEPRSWSGRAHTQAASWALGAAHRPRITGLPSSRSAGAQEASSLCKGASNTEKEGRVAVLGGEVHPRRAMGTRAQEPRGLGFRQRDGPGPRCWVGRAWESSGWSRSRAEALEGLGHAVTLSTKCGMKCSWPVPKSRRSSGQEQQTATPSSGSECMSHTCEASPGGPRSLT